MVEPIYPGDPDYCAAMPRGRRQRGFDEQGNPTEMVYYLRDTPIVGESGFRELLRRAVQRRQELDAAAPAEEA